MRHIKLKTDTNRVLLGHDISLLWMW